MKNIYFFKGEILRDMKVSIIVPVYNSEKYLKDCLDSLVNQTLKEIEIIAIDDASNDKSLEILKSYKIKYPDKIKVYSNPKNIGQGATRNKGIELATGEYIGFLDSDDYVNFNMYAKMYEMAKKNDSPEIITTGLVFVKNNEYLVNSFKGISQTNGSIINVVDNPKVILDESPSVCNKLFRKDMIKNNPFIEGKRWEDIAFTYAKMFRANKILRFNDADYFYRRRANEGVSSQNNQFNNHLFDIFEVNDFLEKELREANKYEQYEYYIKFIEIAYSLYRVTEIFSWNIDENKKQELINKMCKLILEKYGDWRVYPEELLSSKIGIIELEKINEYFVKPKKISGL